MKKTPVIPLLVDQATFDVIERLAKKDGRSLSNFVERQLKRLLYPNFEPAFPDSYYEEPLKGRQYAKV